MANLREAMAGDDIGAIRQRIDALSQALTRFGEAIHRSAAAGQAAESAGAGDKPSGSSSDGVVDAEFEEVDGDQRGRR